MNIDRFGAWTRRRLGIAAGGLAAAMLGHVTRESTDAKKRKKKIRCRKLLQTCEPIGKENTCCGGLNCDPVDGQMGLHCCFGRQHRCQSIGDCCSGVLCDEVEGLDGNRCCGDGGDFCTEDDDCCFGAGCGSNFQCQFLSDRARKANVGAVDPADMLRRVRELPISTWNYTSDDPSIRHIGPMAQDFAATFGVGTDDRHIHPIDGQGVALAAIQGLMAQLEELKAENVRLAARIDQLEAGRT